MMDLNTMLNGNFNAVDQPTEGSLEHTQPKSPTNNRAFWYASGYSLPISLLSNRSRPIQQNSFTKLRDIQRPDSPQPISSDTWSNESSFTSTANSPTHSRVSSISIPENSQLTPTNLSSSLRDSSSPRTVATSLSQELEQTQPSSEPSFHSRSFSPCNLSIVSDGSKEVLWRSPECLRNSNWSLMTPISEKDMSCIDSPEKENRPSSPSDAILIKRSTELCLRLTKDDPEPRSLGSNLPEISGQTKTAESSLPGVSHFVSHKRAFSAPAFHLPSRQLSTGTPHIFSVDDLTPPNSINPDDKSPKMMTSHSSVDSPLSISSETEAQAIKCMYTPDCDTGSQLRKAISHIFGRNKICTRQIPSRVWVHYCRKHYQRSRYRNPKEYAKLQCDLVQQQIRRVYEWSQVNASLGRAGVVQDWSISVRKREQKRLDDLQNGRKRKASSLDRDTEKDEDKSSEANFKSSNSAVPATAVPDWLLEHCRKGYSTQEILAIFNRLHQEILDDLICTFPDIEILPNITIDQEESWSPSGYAKRHQTVHHKRAKSLNVGMHSIYESGDCRLNNSYLCSLDASNLNLSPVRRISSSSSGSIMPETTYQPVSWPRISSPSSSSLMSETGYQPVSWPRVPSSSSGSMMSDPAYQPVSWPRISDLSRCNSLLALQSLLHNHVF